MDFKEIKNARYLESGAIDCEVLFEEMEEYLPYTAIPDDTTETGQTLWGALMNGEFGEIAPFEATPEMTEAAKEQKLQEIGAWRDAQENSEFVFEFDGHRWDCGKISQSRLTPVVAAAKSNILPDGFFWTDADNNDVAMTPERLIQLDSAMTQAVVAQGFKIHEHQRQMKEDVATLNSLEDIRLYRVGWDRA